MTHLKRCASGSNVLLLVLHRLCTGRGEITIRFAVLNGTTIYIYAAQD